MKNIYLISEAFGTSHKGTAVHAYNIAIQLGRLNTDYNFHMIVPIFLDSDELFYDIPNINIIKIPVSGASSVGLLVKTARNQFINKVERYLKDNESNIDLLHIVYGHYIGKNLSGNYKKIWTCHNVPPNEYPDKFVKKNIISNLANKIYFKLIRLKHSQLIKHYNFDKIIAVSEFTKSELLSVSNTLDVSVIGNGVASFELAKQSTCTNKLEILTLGGIKEHKNIHLITDVIKNLNVTGNKKIIWHVVGPVVNKKYFESFKDIQVDKGKVIYYGKIPQAQLDKLYNKIDYYVQLSKMEGFCLTILEANARGINCIGTNVGAIPDIIYSTKGGIVCEPNADSISGGLNHLMHSEAKIDSNIKLLTEKNWSWSKIAQETLYEYQDKLKDK